VRRIKGGRDKELEVVGSVDGSEENRDSEGRKV
jgi:hypothetical protein